MDHLISLAYDEDQAVVLGVRASKFDTEEAFQQDFFNEFDDKLIYKSSIQRHNRDTIVREGKIRAELTAFTDFLKQTDGSSDELMAVLLNKWQVDLKDYFEGGIPLFNVGSTYFSDFEYDGDYEEEYSKLTLEDIGEMYDSYSAEFGSLEFMLNNPIYGPLLLSQMIETIADDEYSKLLFNLRESTFQDMDPQFIEYLDIYGDTASTFAYNFQISGEYYSQAVSFNVIMSNDMENVWLQNGTYFYEVPILINGVWNPELVLGPNFSGDLQSEINKGLIPMPNFNDKDDDLAFLKQAFIYAGVNYAWVGVDAIDAMADIYFFYGQNLDSQLIEPIVSQYQEIRKDEMRISNSWNIWDANSQTNSSWVDVFDEVLFAVNKDMMKSANPLSNLRGTQILSNRLFNNIIKKEYFMDPSKAELFAFQTLRSEKIDSIKLIDHIFTDIDTVDFSYAAFYPTEKDGQYFIEQSLIDTVDITGLSFLDEYKKSLQRDPFNNAAGQFQRIHNLFGAQRVDFVYPSIALQNAYNFQSDLINEYRDFELTSPNRGGWGAFTHSFDLSFSMDFFNWGIRNDYGEIPMITKLYLGIITNSGLYYSSHGDALLNHAYSQLIG